MHMTGVLQWYTRYTENAAGLLQNDGPERRGWKMQPCGNVTDGLVVEWTTLIEHGQCLDDAGIVDSPRPPTATWYDAKSVVVVDWRRIAFLDHPAGDEVDREMLTTAVVGGSGGTVSDSTSATTTTTPPYSGFQHIAAPGPDLQKIVRFISRCRKFCRRPKFILRSS